MKKKEKRKVVCWCCGRTPKEAKKIIRVSIGNKRIRLCKECRWYLGEYINPLSTLNYLKKKGYKNLNLENYGIWKDKLSKLNPKLNNMKIIFQQIEKIEINKEEKEIFEEKKLKIKNK